jgi:hypothetical protein
MIQIAAVIAIVLIVLVGIQSWRAHQAEERIQTLHAERAAIRAQHAEAESRAIAEQREIETKRQEAHDALIAKARQDALAAVDRARHLERVAGRLRDQITYLAASSSAASPDTPAAAGSAPATSTSVVLAKLYRGVDSEAVELAQALDASRRAGLTCERAYDALTLTAQ